MTFNKKGFRIRTDLVHKANAIRELTPSASKRLSDLAFSLANHEYFKVKIDGTTITHWRINDSIYGTTNVNNK